MSSLNDMLEDVQSGDKYALVLAEVENDNRVDDIKKFLSEQLNLDNKLAVVGNLSADSSTLTITGHLLQLLRKYGVHKTEREMVLSYDDTLVAVQLCLAEENKQKTGDFDVEASAVLEMHKYLIEDKLGVTDVSNEEYLALKQCYDTYLKQCNVMDCIDVLLRLKEEINVNDALKKEISNTSFLVMNYSGNSVEKAMLSWLADGKQCYTVAMECSLDDSLIDAGSYTLEPCDIGSKMSITPCRSVNTPGNIGGRSVTESYAENILISYLHLLVNTRSEMALALVLNIPNRDLDHKAFTCVKREAKKKKMSMYQAIVSHVMRIRLGGRSYAPDPNSALNYHIKGLAEFTDLINKLMTIIEEDSNTRSAIRRVLNILKNTIIKSKDNNLRKESIEDISSKLHMFAERTIEIYEKVEEQSPKRNPQNGGSLVGRRTLRVIQVIVDRYSSRLPSGTHVNILTDVFSSQATPVRFPSLMSKFRSPLEASPGSIESQSLAERMKKKLSSQVQKQVVVPRYQSNMNWAQPLHNVGLKKQHDTLLIEDFIPSKTLVVPASKDKSQGIARKVLESLHDQENDILIPSKETSDSTSISNSQKLNSTNKQTEQQKSSSQKRPLSGNVQLGQPAAKKSKKTASKAGKKKDMALQKGQKQLTAFFRI